MPYIKPDSRMKFDEGLNSILDALKEGAQANGNELDPGDVNYVVSSIVWELFKLDRRYVTANALIGALECAKLELYRRQIAPYEDKKTAENGDLP